MAELKQLALKTYLGKLQASHPFSVHVNETKQRLMRFGNEIFTRIEHSDYISCTD